MRVGTTATEPCGAGDDNCSLGLSLGSYTTEELARPQHTQART